MAKVILFSYDADVERVCAAAMRSCYSPYSAYDLFTHTSADDALSGEGSLDENRVAQLLRKAVELGHHGVLEHGSFTFDIQGVSRACSHQLVRHRLASFSQQSQRYVKIRRRQGYVRPPAASDSDRVELDLGGRTLEVSFDEVLELATRAEELLLSKGMRAEDARYLRPNAAETNIVATMNPRELLHICSLRCAPDAQWEIRGVAWAMFTCAQLVAPNIFETLPNASASEYIQRNVGKLRESSASARTALTRTAKDGLVRISLDGLGLESPIEAYVRKM